METARVKIPSFIHIRYLLFDHKQDTEDNRQRPKNVRHCALRTIRKPTSSLQKCALSLSR